MVAIVSAVIGAAAAIARLALLLLDELSQLTSPT